MRKTAEENLLTAAELLSRAVLKMCRRVLKKTEEEEGPDPKFLKEAGAAVKEAVSVVSALEKKDTDKDEGIRIVFEMAENVME